MVVLMPAPLCGMGRVLDRAQEGTDCDGGDREVPGAGRGVPIAVTDPIMIVAPSIPWMAPKTVVPHSATARRRSDGDREPGLPGPDRDQQTVPILSELR